MTGRVKVKVGPVALTYSGKARFTERDEQAKSIKLEASGKETRGAGTASATVHSWLADEGGQTRVTVRTSMNVTGRPAQFGRGVMADVGGRIIEKFATNLAAQLAAGAQEDAAAASGLVGTAVPGDGAQQASIEDLQLPVRAFNSLRREGIHTIGDLAARNEADLLAINNLGPQSVSEIKEKLAERGLALAPAAVGADGDVAGAAPPTATQAPAAPSLVMQQTGRPPDEDAIDLLSVAGFPVLKRALPAVGVVAAFVLLLMLGRRRRRRRGSGTA